MDKNIYKKDVHKVVKRLPHAHLCAKEICIKKGGVLLAKPPPLSSKLESSYLTMSSICPTGLKHICFYYYIILLIQKSIPF